MRPLGTVGVLVVSLITLGTSIKPASCSEIPNISYQTNNQVLCLADTVFFEAAGEPTTSKEAVAQVVMNRTTSNIFPATVCGVVYQKTKRKAQFSWIGIGQKKRIKHKHKNLQAYVESLYVAQKVFYNHKQMKDHTRGALFYHASYKKKRVLGMKNLKMTAKVGRHIFYDIKES